MIVRTVAPAKINWTLEVLGKRDDGYHEIRSVMQTIDLCDEVEVETSDRTKLSAEGYEPDEDDLALRAVRALEEATGRELPVSISLLKRIPVAAGLGGGSSDAAAVLRAVNRLYELGLSREDLAAIGAGIGSDVPFFLYGGTALAEGRGERVTVLPDVGETWVVVFAPPISIEGKSRRMYGELMPDDFTDGALTERLTAAVRAGRRPDADRPINAFDRTANDVFAGLAEYRDRLVGAGAETAYLSGAGPTLFALFAAKSHADGVARALAGSDARVFVARTMGAVEGSSVVVGE